MTIPKQLHGLRFIVLNGKVPPAWQEGWRENNHFAYDHPKIVNRSGNYGVLTGLENIGVLDDDTDDKILTKIFQEKLGKTFLVHDHSYIELSNWNKKKVVFTHDSFGSKKSSLQGLGQYVVGPGSIHPKTHKTYEIKENVPILKIDFLEFKEHFKEFIEEKKQVPREFKRTEWEGDNVNNIPLSRIISFTGKGAHPVHGSTTGNNFIIDEGKNLWHCFRCSTGGGPAELIAVLHRIKDCVNIGPSCFSRVEGREIIEIARSRYGLRKPKPKNVIAEITW